MSITDKIRVLCARCNVSVAELARRLNTSPQSLNGKMKRESFTIADLERIANVLGARFDFSFVLNENERF